MDIIDYAKMASGVWNGLDEKNQNDLKKNFHLRPTESGITVVSTVPNFAMRGITGIKDEKTLKETLNGLSKKLPRINADNDETVHDTMKSFHFKKRNEDKKNKKSNLEEDVQATMIRTMSDDQNLKKGLGLKDPMQFIASELIFSADEKNRIDIVGFDGETLFFLELKRKRTTKVEQVKNYVDFYSKPKKLETLKQLLGSYPINPVSDFKEIKGVMAMEYAVNSKENWKELAEKNGIEIIFFETSLKYRHVK